jgi:hypothetical protein
VESETKHDGAGEGQQKFSEIEWIVRFEVFHGILVKLMMEALGSSETSVIRVTRRHIPEYGIIYGTFMSMKFTIRRICNSWYNSRLYCDVVVRLMTPYNLVCERRRAL